MSEESVLSGLEKVSFKTIEIKYQAPLDCVLDNWQSTGGTIAEANNECQVCLCYFLSDKLNQHTNFSGIHTNKGFH